MVASNSPSTTTESAPTGQSVQTKDASDEIGLHRSQAEAIMAQIVETARLSTAKSEEIEVERGRAERAKIEIESQLALARETLASLQQQIDSTKIVVAELATLQTTAQTMASQTSEAKNQAAAVLELLQGFAKIGDDVTSRLVAIRTGAEQTAAVIATKSDHIEEGRVHVDDARARVDRIFTQAQESATSAEAQHQAARTSAANANELTTALQIIKGSAEAQTDAVSKLRSQCEQHMAASKAIAEIAEDANSKVNGYQDRLGEFEKHASALLKQIESLLPGAASAGLASAFTKRREVFKNPQSLWQWVFIISVLLLVFIGSLQIRSYANDESGMTLSKLGLTLLYHLPVALPFIWLAFHASHQAALAQRVEEDYAFKATVSSCFEGFRREMSDLEGKTAPNSALSMLCGGVLAIITNPPGRIYEKHRLSITPLTALADSAGPIAEAASKVLPTK